MEEMDKLPYYSVFEKGVAYEDNKCRGFWKGNTSTEKKRGYTQSYLAEVSGFSTSFISDLENGKVTAELGKAIVLADLLGIDVEMNARL